MAIMVRILVYTGEAEDLRKHAKLVVTGRRDCGPQQGHVYVQEVYRTPAFAPVLVTEDQEAL